MFTKAIRRSSVVARFAILLALGAAAGCSSGNGSPVATGGIPVGSGGAVPTAGRSTATGGAGGVSSASADTGGATTSSSNGGSVETGGTQGNTGGATTGGSAGGKGGNTGGVATGGAAGGTVGSSSAIGGASTGGRTGSTCTARVPWGVMQPGGVGAAPKIWRATSGDGWRTATMRTPTVTRLAWIRSPLRWDPTGSYGAAPGVERPVAALGIFALPAVPTGRRIIASSPMGRA